MEADVLRWSLLTIGSVVIVGLAVHGIWISRRNNEKESNTSASQPKQEYQPSEQDSDSWQSNDEVYDEIVAKSNDELTEEPVIKFDVESNEELSSEVQQDVAEEFDELGLGAVRVISADKGNDNSENSEQSVSETNEQQTQKTEESEISPSKIYASVVTQPKPEYVSKEQPVAEVLVDTGEPKNQNVVKTEEKVQASTSTLSNDLSASQSNGALGSESYQAPEPPPFLLKQETAESSRSQKTEDKTPEPSVAKASLAEQARSMVGRKKTESSRKRREPRMAEDQLHIEFDDVPEIAPKQQAPKKPPVEEQPKTKTEQQQEVLVLNVKSAEDQPIPGSALLPMLLTLGFKFGDQDIFHRHVNSNGKGQVLFSLANMFKPGNFDIDNLENFTTQGISLFMILPIEGDPHQVFNMMHNAARKIADEFSAQIYDGKRALLTKQSLQQYVEKIREFERQRLIN